MQYRDFIGAVCLGGLFCESIAWAQSPATNWGQAFPTKPLRILSGDAGGTSDSMTRLVAEGLSQILRQPTVVFNRTGVIAVPVMEVIKSNPDGYTLLGVGANQFWLEPFLQEDYRYDPVKDFAPVSLTARSPNLVVVHPAVAATNIKELIALARA